MSDTEITPAPVSEEAPNTKASAAKTTKAKNTIKGKRRSNPALAD